MKIFSLLIFLLCLFQNAKSQAVFCPPGAEWKYSFWSMFAPGPGPEGIKYVRDSVIGTDTVKVLLHARLFKKNNTAPGNKLSLIKQSGDVVYFKNLSTQNNWQILYNFGATAGQTWQNTISLFYTSPGTLTAIYQAIVDSVNYTNVNGFNLKRLYVKYWSQYADVLTGYDKVVITERYGCTAFMFNFFNKEWETDGDAFPALRCYTDNAFGTRQLTELTCDFSNVGFADQKKNPENIVIYPNPGTGVLNIDFEDEMAVKNASVIIMDLSGRVVKREVLEKLNRINISELTEGIYLLQISDQQRLIYSEKLVKE